MIADGIGLGWRPSALAGALATCAGIALVLAVFVGRPQLVGFAAPLLGVLASATWQPARARYRVRASAPRMRCFAGETVPTTVTAEPVGRGAPVRIAPVPTAGVRITTDPAGTDSAGTGLRIAAERWGRYELAVELTASDPAGLFVGTARCRVAELHVYPVADPAGTRLPPTELPDRLGTHRTRRAGVGVEFAGVREYVPGDRLGSVNWRASARTQRLQVTERLAEHAGDLVVLLDGYAQPPGPATEATELAVRGATQVVQSALQVGDRAGVVTLGGRLRWLAPEPGRRQFYRVLDAMLDIGDGHHRATGTLAPRAAVPRGAVVVAFSTMLDTEFALALIELRRRGHVVVAVDVLQDAPFHADPLVRRMWRLERSAMYRDMAAVGVDVAPWPAETALDEALRPVPDRTRFGGRR